MTRTFGFFCILGGLVFAVLLNMLMLPPGSAAQEPVPRPSPTPQPWMLLTPDQAVAGQDFRVLVTGGLWPTLGTITLTWESTAGALLHDPVAVAADGSFSAEVLIPASWLTPGTHFIFAVHSGGAVASAALTVWEPTPTNTPSPTATPRPTNTSAPLPSSTMTSTPSPTITPTPSRTMRPVTPDVTNTPRPAATVPPAAATSVPSTDVPTATPSATPLFLGMVTATPTASATSTDTPTTTPTASRTSEATATNPPVPRETRGPGQQLAEAAGTTEPAALVEPSQPEAGSTSQPGFAQGFVAAAVFFGVLMLFLLLVLVTILVIRRSRRARGTGSAV